MGILIISIIAFVLVCFIINLIDKNKNKIKEKLKIQKQEFMMCPNCSAEYEDLSLHFCKNCNTSLERKTKYNISKKIKRIGIVSILIIVALIICGVYINNYIEEQERINKYNEDISLCYEVIKDKSDWEEFKKIIDNHGQESNFEPEAFEKLYQAIDERIESIKNGNEDEQLLTMLNTIKEDFSSDSTSNTILQKIEEKYLISNSYSNINKCDKYIQEQNYKEAFDLLNTIIMQNKDKNQEIVDKATNKQNEIKDKAFEQIINEAQTQINNQDYSSAQNNLKNYKDLGNQTILDMYNNVTNEVNRIEAERKAQEEAERKAQQQKAEEERKQREAEEKARKKSQGVTIGMTQQEVLDSMWGEPERINRTVTENHVYEQWVYEYPNYLYFTDGILTSIQN